MKVTIEFDIDVFAGEDEEAIHDLIGDWTYQMRTARRLNSWHINYDPSKRY